MKRKLLFAAALLVGALGFNANAQTDVTEYIKNADFSEGTPATVGICTYNYDMQTNGTTFYGMQPVTNWVATYPCDPEAIGYVPDGKKKEDVEAKNVARAAGIIGVNSGVWLGGKGDNGQYNAPTTNSAKVSSGNVLGIMGVWGAESQYTQEIELPAGAYALTFTIYNNGGAGNVEKNLFGFIVDGKEFLSEYLSKQTTFETDGWQTQTVKFAFDAPTKGKISIGLKVKNAGNKDVPHLFVDNVKLETSDYAECLEEYKKEALAALENLSPQGEGLFYYSKTEIAAARTAIQNATTVTEVDEAIPTIKLPQEGQGYIISNNTIEGGSLCVTNKATVEKNAWVYFTPKGNGYIISNAAGEYIFKTTNDTWTFSTTTNPDEAYVLTVNRVDGGYTFSGLRGIIGSDDKAIGATLYANKAATNNGVWSITETEVSEDLLKLVGVYYIYNEKTGKFMSRGSRDGAGGTDAMADEYGLPIRVGSSVLGELSLKCIDSNLYYGGDYWMVANAGAKGYMINAVDGKEGVYTIKNLGLNQDVYINTAQYGIAGNAILSGDGKNCDGIEYTYWKLLTVEEYDKIQEAKAAAIAAKVAEEASVENFDNYAVLGEPTVLTFVNAGEGWTYLAEPVVDDKVKEKGDFGIEAYQKTQKITRTVDVEQGLYKVSVQGFYRGGGNANVWAAYNKQGYDFVLSYLDANGATVRLANWAEHASTDTSKPNSVGDALTQFNNGDYVKSVVAYVGEEGKLDLTINCPSNLPSGWLILNNVTYTKMEEPTVKVGKAGYATYVAPVDVKFDGVTAYVVSSVEGGYAILDEVDEVPAGTPVIVEAKEGSHVLTAIKGATLDADNELQVVKEEELTVNNSIYILANLDDEVGFYAVDAIAVPKLPVGHVYLEVDSSNGIKFIGFGNGGDATGIKNVEAAEAENAVIYNLAGQRVANPTKGIYIVNGKKVLVK